MRYDLQINNLTKSYKKKKVVNDFHLEVKKGHIYGLIGPNGAGKTTIMKMIAGLVQPDNGEIKLFGENKDLDEKRQRISFMIEIPYLDGSMTARQNMECIRYIRGVADEKRIDEILELVGLKDAGNKKVKLFSLGMKQRLGIGMALLPSPEIMILDEPVNGLDPEGIVDVRNILKKLCIEEGITILISSHLLSELSELCTDFAFINQGRLVECLSAEELESKCRNYLAVRTDDISKTIMVLEQELNVKDYQVIEQEELHLYEGLDAIESISKTITSKGLVITKFVLEGESLEAYYLSKIEKGGVHHE